MKRPSVTPIFPKNNGPTIPDNLPIRKADSREHMLHSGGFASGFHPNYTHLSPHPNLSHHPNLSSVNNCIDIARHIDTCPICSRLYDTDKTLYILAILGLLILCFLMVKRIVKI